MKKALISIMCVIMVVFFTACDNKNSETTVSTSTTQPFVTKQAVTSTTTKKKTDESTPSTTVTHNSTKAKDQSETKDTGQNSSDADPQKTNILGNSADTAPNEQVNSRDTGQTVTNQKPVSVPEPEPEPEPEPTSVSFNSSNYIVGDREREMFDYINSVRSQNGISALYFNYDYYDLVAVRTNELPISYSHTRPDGSKFYTIFTNNGIDVGMGENLAKWNSVATTNMVMEAFMASETHRDNILNPAYSSVCICTIYDENSGMYYAANEFFE